MREDDLLNDLFLDARQSTALPKNLEARVLSDAYAVQDTFAPRAAPAPRRRLFSEKLLAALSVGALALGLGSAAMAGIVIGYAQPLPLEALFYETGAVLELMPSEDLIMLEE